MDLQLPADIDTAVKSFLAGGQYKDEAEVLRNALAALKQNDDNTVDIQAGIEDMDTGRVRPWSEIKSELESKHGRLGEE